MSCLVVPGSHPSGNKEGEGGLMELGQTLWQLVVMGRARDRRLLFPLMECAEIKKPGWDVIRTFYAAGETPKRYFSQTVDCHQLKAEKLH